MPWNLVQSKVAESATAGTAISATYDTAPTVGNFLMAVTAHTGVDILPDTSWGTWSIAVGSINVVYHHFKIAEPGESATFSVTSGSSVSWAVVLMEWDGFNGSYVGNDTVAVDAGSGAGDATYTCNAPGVTEPNDLCIGSFAQQATAFTVTWSAGWTELVEVTPPSSPVLALAVATRELTSVMSNLLTVDPAGTTTQEPSMINQCLFAYGDPGHNRLRMTSWSQW